MSAVLLSKPSLADLLIDPVVRIDLAMLGLTPRHLELLERLAR